MGIQLKYFVLKPKAKTKNDSFAKASQAAMFAYADEIEKTDYKLSESLRTWAANEASAQHHLPDVRD